MYPYHLAGISETIVSRQGTDARGVTIYICQLEGADHV